MKPQERQKKEAAIAAVDLIEPGMCIGLGSGSTVFYALEEIGKRLKSGKLTDVNGIPSSKQTEQLAKQFGIKLTSFGELDYLDINIDGADEVDKNLNMIKGGGGALLREKVVAQFSKRNIIIVDESKLSKKLGEKWFVPVEVVPFAKDAVLVHLKNLNGAPVVRRDANDKVYKTDQRNIILDCDFGVIERPDTLDKKINMIAGVVENGLFCLVADMVIVAGKNGIRYLK